MIAKLTLGHEISQEVKAIRRLPVTHEENVTAMELILNHADNGGVGVGALRAYQEFRRKIDGEVRLCKMQAGLEWIKGHGKPHCWDLGQTIPPN